MRRHDTRLTRPTLSLLVALGIATLPVRGQGSPGGDLLNLPFVGTGEDAKQIVFAWVRFPDCITNPGSCEPDLTFPRLEEIALLTEARLEGQAYGTLDVVITIAADYTNPVDPQPILLGVTKANFLNEALVPIQERATRFRGVVEQALAGTSYPLDDFDREVIFCTDNVWNAPGAKGGYNYRTVYMPHDIEPAVEHELGHTFGFEHANSIAHYECPSYFLPSEKYCVCPVPVPEPEMPKSINYGDWFDPMGIGGRTSVCPNNDEVLHHFNPWFKLRAGWLSPNHVETIVKSSSPLSQVVALRRFNATPGPPYPSAIRIPRDDYNDYWIFWRRNEPLIDNDAATITLSAHTTTNGPQLLNLSDETMILEDCNLDEAALEGELKNGQTFMDTDSGISIRNFGIQNGRLIIGVLTPLNQLPDIDDVPRVDVITPSRGVTSTGDLTYEITAVDPDGAGPGDGIASVEFYLYRKDDSCLAPLTSFPPRIPDPANCSPSQQGVDTVAPYTWTPPVTVPTGDWLLVIRAIPDAGPENIVWFRHFIDNGFGN